MIKSITGTDLDNSDAFRSLDGKKVQERRLEPRIIAFCQVFDPQGNFIGSSFDITCQGICFSLPKTWTPDSPFSVTLKRADNPSLADVTISVEVRWRDAYNEDYDTIGGRVVKVDSTSNLEALVNYCRETGPHGLCSSGE